jgi:hypothetical protein
LVAVQRRGCIDFAGRFALGRLAGDGETYYVARRGFSFWLLPGKLKSNHLNG